jgi:anti-anti-sigma factor
VLLEVDYFPGVTRLYCSDRVVRGEGADDLLRTVMTQGARRLEIDLSWVRSVDARGLGVFAELAAWAKENNRTLRLLNPSTRIHKLLQAVGLATVLDIRFGRFPHCRRAAVA